MDPLLVLRRCLRNGEEISLHDNGGNVVNELSQSVFLKLAKLIYPRDVPTNFRSKRGAGDFYPLDAVWFMLQCRESSFGEYMQEARRMGVMAVSLVDRKELLSYLEEDVRPEECPYVDVSAALPVPRRTFGEGEEAALEEAAATTTTTTTTMGDKGETLATEPKNIGTAMPHLVPSKRISSRPVRAREASLVSSATKDFSAVLTSAKELLKSLAEPESSETPSTTAKQPQSLIEQIASANRPALFSERTPSTRPAAPKSLVPIIVVPAAPSANLTMYNCLRFLGEGCFLPSSAAKAQGHGKENSLSLEHKFSSSPRPLRFQIIDNPTRLPAEEWSRVIAVFVQGNTWQFKGWKWESPVELFQHVLGFALDFEDAKVDPKVAGWKVHRLTIGRSHRHLDATAAFQFWARIEDLLKARRLL